MRSALRVSFSEIIRKSPPKQERAERKTVLTSVKDLFAWR
jgi:hypothetical protein